jgi:predicted HicB family RNase H-like nuclease
MNKATELLKRAEKEAQTAETWADFSNLLFDPFEGLVTKAYPTREAREAFVKTQEYRKITDLLSQVRERTGLVAGATPKKKSGRFVVRLPVSLHAALEREAEVEGVSLNQLVVAKLSASLGSLLERKREKASV